MSGQMAMWATYFQSICRLANTYEDIDTNALELAQSIQYMTTPAPSLAEILRVFEQHTRAILVDSDNLENYL